MDGRSRRLACPQHPLADKKVGKNFHHMTFGGYAGGDGLLQKHEIYRLRFIG